MDGSLIDERQSSVKHEPLAGMNIQDLFCTDPVIRHAWESCMQGIPYAWISLHHTTVPLLCSMIPYAPLHESAPLGVIGFAQLISPELKAWAEAKGVVISPLG